MTLQKYHQKRSFDDTPEPKGTVPKSKSKLPEFVVQKHDASHLHYDFRLEHKGVLLSWAVPKGPSMNPNDKRLAIHVEDHPYEYRLFEGTIPKGNYGAGTVEIWDKGTFETPELTIDQGLKKGHLIFTLHGNKLQGTFNLVKLKDGENWLLIKGKDEKKKRTKLPGFIKPMLATLKKEPFDDPDWLFEIKWDGYRSLAYIDETVNLYSRNENLFNSLFPFLIKDLEKIQDQCILDGEIVLLDENGKADFQLMQNYQRTQKGNLFYYAFDLIYLNGEDYREKPLIERKEALKNLLDRYPLEIVRYEDHVEKKGRAFFKEAKKLEVEGILAKRKQSAYYSTRTKEWFKIKTGMRQEAVIGGFTAARGSRNHFGALLLGVFDKDKFIYIGHVGTGFTASSLKDINEKLGSLIIEKSPFEQKIKTNMPCTWVKPELVCEVAFSEWTDDGILRQPSFKGLRIDKRPKEIKREIPS